MPNPTPDPSPLDPDREPPRESAPDVDPASLEGKGLPAAPKHYDRSIEESSEALRLEHAKGWARFDQARAPPVDFELIRRFWLEGQSTLEEQWIVERLARTYDTWSRAFVDGLKGMLYADKLAGRMDEPEPQEDVPREKEEGAVISEDEGTAGYGLSSDAKVPPSVSHDWVLEHLLAHHESPARMAADPREAPEIDYDLVRRLQRFSERYPGRDDLFLPLGDEGERAGRAVECYPAWELALLAAEIETSCGREMPDPVDFELIHRFVRGQLHEVETGWLRRTAEKHLAWRVAILAARTELEARGE